MRTAVAKAAAAIGAALDAGVTLRWSATSTSMAASLPPRARKRWSPLLLALIFPVALLVAFARPAPRTRSRTVLSVAPYQAATVQPAPATAAVTLQTVAAATRPTPRNVEKTGLPRPLAPHATRNDTQTVPSATNPPPAASATVVPEEMDPLKRRK